MGRTMKQAQMMSLLFFLPRGHWSVGLQNEHAFDLASRDNNQKKKM